MAEAYPFQDMNFQEMPASQGINPNAAAPNVAAPAAGMDQQAQTRAALERMKAELPPNEWAQFVTQMQSLPPEQQALAITQMATNYTESAGDAQADMTRADALRQDMPSGREVGSGIYVAANPLEYAGKFATDRKRNEEYDAAKLLRTGARAGQTAAVEGAMSRALNMKQ
jgi:hypothetical protein